MNRERKNKLTSEWNKQNILRVDLTGISLLTTTNQEIFFSYLLISWTRSLSAGSKFVNNSWFPSIRSLKSLLPKPIGLSEDWKKSWSINIKSEWHYCNIFNNVTFYQKTSHLMRKLKKRSTRTYNFSWLYKRDMLISLFIFVSAWVFVFTEVDVILTDLWKGHSFNLRVFMRHAPMNTDFFSFCIFYKLTGYVLQNF